MTRLPYRRILVTGGAGFIGSHLVDRLLAAGVEVVVVDNFDPFYDPNEKRANTEPHLENSAFRLFETDIRDGQRLEEVFRLAKPEAVVHLAARAGVRPSVEEPGTYAEVNIMGTINLLKTARNRGIDRFVFGSSSSVYGDNPKVPFCEDDAVVNPASPYGATKIAGEALCESFSRCYGLPIVALRFFTVYGPRQRPDLAIHKFARLMLAGRPIPVFGDGRSERDYTYIDDIVEGLWRALCYQAFPNPRVPFRVFNLGSDRPVSLLDLVQSLAQVLGRKAVVQHCPEQLGDVRRTWAGVTRAREELGYSPRVSFQDGLERFAEWLRERTACSR